MASFSVLLVDDEDDFVVLLSIRLQTRNLDVRTARTGEDALRQLAERPVDVVVLDVRLPGMDGVETLEQIKQRYPDIEVIMLTGFADAQVVSRVLNRGAFDYLLKPVDIEELLDKIHQAREHQTGQT